MRHFWWRISNGISRIQIGDHFRDLADLRVSQKPRFELQLTTSNALVCAPLLEIVGIWQVAEASGASPLSSSQHYKCSIFVAIAGPHCLRVTSWILFKYYLLIWFRSTKSKKGRDFDSAATVVARNSEFASQLHSLPGSRARSIFVFEIEKFRSRIQIHSILPP